MTASIQTFTNGTNTNLNFSIAASTAYGSNALKTVGPVLCMYSGDANSNGVISASDINLFWLLQAGNIGYYSADFNLNGVVSASDVNLFWLLNSGIIEQHY